MSFFLGHIVSIYVSQSEMAVSLLAGLMGLCTGFSFLSGFEVFYHLFSCCFDGVNGAKKKEGEEDEEEDVEGGKKEEEEEEGNGRRSLSDEASVNPSSRSGNSATCRIL